LYQHTLHYIHPSPVVDNSVRPNMLIQEVFGRAQTRSSSNSPIMISVLFIKSYKIFYLDKVLNTGSLAVVCSSSSSCTLLNKLEAFKGFQEVVDLSNMGKGLNFCCCCCCSSLLPVPIGLLTPAVAVAFAVALGVGLV